jgi:hypothetical protein
VRLPYCDAAYAELAGARRRRRNAAWAAALSLVLALLAVSPALFDTRAAAAGLAVIGAGLFVLAVYETWRIRAAGVGVNLDGSRRWASLTKVSDAFAGAAAAQLDRERDRI